MKTRSARPASARAANLPYAERTPYAMKALAVVSRLGLCARSLPQSYSRTAAILVDEFDPRGLQGRLDF